MSKELEALKNIHNSWNCCNPNSYGCDEKDFALIETALKDFEDIKHICGSYDIEFNLTNIRHALFTFAQLKGEYGTNWGNYEKKLKALKIIKEKKVLNDRYLMSGSLKAYNQYVKMCRKDSAFKPKELTQKEFDLLKEVLL